VHCVYSRPSLGKRSDNDHADPTPNPNLEADFFSPVQQFHLYFWFFLFLFIAFVYCIYLLASLESDSGVNAASSYVQKINRR